MGKIERSLHNWSAHNACNYKKGDLLVGSIGKQMFGLEVVRIAQRFVKCKPYNLEANLAAYEIVKFIANNPSKNFLSNDKKAIGDSKINGEISIKHWEPLITNDEYSLCAINPNNYSVMPYNNSFAIYKYLFDWPEKDDGLIKLKTTQVLLDRIVFENKVVNITNILNEKDSYLDKELMKLFTPIAVVNTNYKTLAKLTSNPNIDPDQQIIFFKISDKSRWVDEYIILSNAKVLYGIDEIQCYFDRPYKYATDLNLIIKNKDGVEYKRKAVFFRCNYWTGLGTSNSINDKGCTLTSISSFYKYHYKWYPLNEIKDDKYKIINFSRESFREFADQYFAYNTKNGLYYGWGYYLYVDNDSAFLVDLYFFEEFYRLVRKMKNIEQEIKNIEPVYYKKAFFSTYWIEDEYLMRFANYVKESETFVAFFEKVRIDLLTDIHKENYLTSCLTPKQILINFFKSMDYVPTVDITAISNMQAHSILINIYKEAGYLSYEERTVMFLKYGLLTLKPMNDEDIMVIVSVPENVYKLIENNIYSAFHHPQSLVELEQNITSVLF